MGRGDGNDLCRTLQAILVSACLTDKFVSEFLGQQNYQGADTSALQGGTFNRIPVLKQAPCLMMMNMVAMAIMVAMTMVVVMMVAAVMVAATGTPAARLVLLAALCSGKTCECLAVRYAGAS